MHIKRIRGDRKYSKDIFSINFNYQYRLERNNLIMKIYMENLFDRLLLKR